MPTFHSVVSLADSFSPGEHIFLSGSSGEAIPLIQGLTDDPERTRGLRITTSFVPGMNHLDPDSLHPTARLAGLFMQPSLRAAQASGRYAHHTESYGGFVRLIRERMQFDTCVVQVTPPDANGRCSLGPAVEFTLEVIARSRRVIAVINPLVPRIPTSPTLDYTRFDCVAEVDHPLSTYDVGVSDAQSQAIAARIARYIEDKAALQIGLGKVPSALLNAIGDRRGLRLQSGMLSDGLMALAAGGALDPAWRHATCVLVGTPGFLEWSTDRGDIHVLGCGETHDPVHLSGLQGFIAVNSALEVDLLGQCNLEMKDGHAISGPGGAPDFSHAASRSPGGTSIIALPSTFGGGTGSRILARLGPDAISTLPRSSVDVVVTEHGAADLRGLSVHARAEALMTVAAPAFRAGLQEGWNRIAARL